MEITRNITDGAVSADFNSILLRPANIVSLHRRLAGVQQPVAIQCEPAESTSAMGFTGGQKIANQETREIINIAMVKSRMEQH
jgi:hypothetical protein